MDGLLASHRRLIGPRRDASTLPTDQIVVLDSHTDRQSTLVVRTDTAVLDPAWQVEEMSLEDIVLAYMGGDGERRPSPRPALGVLR